MLKLKKSCKLFLMANRLPGDITGLLKAWGEGDETALENLTPLVYRELHRLARRYMSQERSSHTLQSKHPRLRSGRRNYDVTADGQRFLMIKGYDQQLSATQMNLVLDWFDDLKSRPGTSQR